MGADSKVVWSEGMFLRPQHFQQHDRYFERLVRSRVSGLTPFSYGISELKLNSELLGRGKFAVAQCRGIMPDGTPFDVASDGNHPSPLELGGNVRNEIIYLVLPEQQPGQAEVVTNGHDSLAARYGASSYRAVDAIAGSDSTSNIQIGKLRLSYALQSSERAGYVSLGLARVSEVRTDKAIVLDERYIPPTLLCPGIPALAGIATEIQGLLHHRGQELGNLAAGGSAGAAATEDILHLQVVNRYEPLFGHYANLTELHPQTLFSRLIEIAGELATFTSQSRRTIAFPEYRHDDLQSSFMPVLSELRRSFSYLPGRRAVKILIREPNRWGIRAAALPDKTLLVDADFVLAVKADIQSELVRKNFHRPTKIGPVEEIERLVNDQLPGITIRPLPAAPRQVPYAVDTTYFELDRTSQPAMWKSLKTSAGLAFHVAGDFPGLLMELWAVRK